jgi:outer membrane protein assembly factor BamE (lipoprotein component of BamABCDE complex)
MKHRFLLRVSALAAATGTLILSSCSTPQTRISEHPDFYQSLSPRDQALVSQEQIRLGMSRTAAWLAWGSPDRKIIGNMGRGPTETWVYVYYATRPYYPFEPLDEYFGAPLYDPFCYSWFPASIPYPGKLVTFAHGKVVSYQYVTSR